MVAVERREAKRNDTGSGEMCQPVIQDFVNKMKAYFELDHEGFVLWLWFSLVLSSCFLWNVGWLEGKMLELRIKKESDTRSFSLGIQYWGWFFGSTVDYLNLALYRTQKKGTAIGWLAGMLVLIYCWFGEIFIGIICLILIFSKSNSFKWNRFPFQTFQEIYFVFLFLWKSSFNDGTPAAITSSFMVEVIELNTKAMNTYTLP